MVFDCLDYMEWKTGYRLTGMGSAIVSFVNKFGNALATSAIILMYIVVGLNVSEINAATTVNPLEVDPSIRGGMFNIISIIPAISLLLCTVPLFFYKITGKFKDQIESELAVQRAEKGIVINE